MKIIEPGPFPRSGSAQAPLTRTVAIIVPTFNERGNVESLINGVRAGLGAENWEIIFVDDDSPDGTWREVQRVAFGDPRVRLIRRVGRKGLASACIEGVMSTTASYVAIMDGDGQHDPRHLQGMLGLARSRQLDVVIASRQESAGSEPFRSRFRRWLSRTGNALGRLVVRGATRDPLSGYFLARREIFEERVGQLYGHGFKILLDLLSSSSTPLRIAELPAILQPRLQGASKLNPVVALDYAMLVGWRMTGRLVSPRFILYCAVGSVGVVVHLAVLQQSYLFLDSHFLPAQALATFAAMTSNYFLNNALTFRDRMLRGFAIWKGLFSFYLACSLGALIGVAVGQFLHTAGFAVWASGLGGALASAVWNFTLNSALTWGRP